MLRIKENISHHHDGTFGIFFMDARSSPRHQQLKVQRSTHLTLNDPCSSDSVLLDDCHSQAVCIMTMMYA